MLHHSPSLINNQKPLFHRRANSIPDKIQNNSLVSESATNVILNKQLPENFVTRFSIENRTINEAQTPTKISDIKTPPNNTYYLPFPELAEASNGIGVVEVQSDKDGIYRHGRLLHNYAGKHYPALSITSILDQTPLKNINRIDNTVLFDDLAIPVDENERSVYRKTAKNAVSSFSGQWIMLAYLHVMG